MEKISIWATYLFLALNAWTTAQKLQQLCNTFGRSRSQIQDSAMRLHACHSTLTLLDWKWRMEAKSMAPAYAIHLGGDLSDDILSVCGAKKVSENEHEKAGTPTNSWQIGCREMQKYLQHLNSIFTTAQSLIESATQSSETVQTGEQDPSTLPSQHSTRKCVHALFPAVDSLVCRRTASTQRLMTTREQRRRYDDPFMAFFVGIPPRGSFTVVREDTTPPLFRHV
jgi:hypothetical protein